MESQGTDHYVLFVTGPLRERLYEHFSALFDGRDDVVVRIDRRAPSGVASGAAPPRRAARRRSPQRRARLDRPAARG